jgi:TonB family protein
LKNRIGFMLKRSNAWDLQPPAMISPPGNVVRMSPNARRASSVPRFNYELSPRRWDRLGVSVVLHGVALVLMVQLAIWLPRPHVEREKAAVVPLFAPVVQRPVPKLPPLPPPQVLAKIQPPPRPNILPAPAPAPQPLKVEPPKIEEKPPEVAKALPEPVVPKPILPKRQVVENTFDSGSSAPQTVKKPAREVQTGGFGDPNGVRGNSEKKGPVTIASLGSFDLPSGAGNGNGRNGTHGTPGAVAPSGFGDGVAGTGSGDRPHGAVSQGAFGTVTAGNTGPRRGAEAAPETIPLEIVFKPRPVYTEEARKLRIEGEVLLEVMFTASGELHVQRVLKGLGHGLDEAAQRAAGQIRFHPARRNGQPYDSVALVHINFELAE